MTPAARERLQIRAPMLFISAVAWILLVIEPSGTALSALCSAAMPGTAPSSREMLLALNAPYSLALGWALMLAAMMVPLLIAPVRHVRDRSFARRRARAVMLFVTAYFVVWMAAGVVLLALAFVVRLFVPGSSMPLAMVTAVALVWQFSPLKQRCLNRCHVQAELAAFGLAADLDALRFGLTHGVWCVGSCWALMLLPFVFSRGNVAAMAAVAVLLFAERLNRPTPPSWRWRGMSKVARIVVAQTRMRLKRS